jgi:protein MpaA
MVMLDHHIFAFEASTIILKRGFVSVPHSGSANHTPSHTIEEHEKAELLQAFCKKVEDKFVRFGWGSSGCSSIPWQMDLKTPEGNPLVYATFGTGRETTVILGGVHPDEITPINLSFRFANHLRDNIAQFKNKDVRVVIAPLANPDGFFRDIPLRTTVYGVDINRNFFTDDWFESALASWERVGRRQDRYFPGIFPNSEIETVFQIRLVKDWNPSKILSIHAPLGFYDYDGPGDQLLLTPQMDQAQKSGKLFVRSVAEKSQNYRVVDYSFYPGSLGNFAGNQRGIPTLTLELETTNPKNVKQDWEKFLPGFVQSIEFPYLKASLAKP